MASAAHLRLCFLERRLLLTVLTFIALPPVAWSQDSADDLTLRGSKAEISVTVRDDSGEPITAAGSVKLFREGMMVDQAPLNRGRAFFQFWALGNYSLTVDAAGYKSAQRDVTVSMAIKFEVDVRLRREKAANEVEGSPGAPVLAPKAQEAFDKSLQALNANKLEEAEKHLAEAAKLAPNHPDVLYLQGVLYLHQKRWAEAQDVLQKVIQLDPKNARALSALGMAFADEGKYDLAIPRLQQSAQLDPASWETHWVLAKTFYHQQDFDGALKESRQALSQSHGQEPGIELLLAQSQVATGRFEDSAETLRTFLKNHPNDKGAPIARRWLDRLIADGKIRK